MYLGSYMNVSVVGDLYFEWYLIIFLKLYEFIGKYNLEEFLNIVCSVNF